MSPDERRCGVSAINSISFKERGLGISIVTEATRAFTHVPRGARETVGFSVREERLPMEVGSTMDDVIESKGATTSSIHSRTKTYDVEREEIYALQTRYNSLHFLPTKRGTEGRLKRSKSFSLPRSKSNSSREDDEVNKVDGEILWKFNFGRRGPRVHKMPLREYKDLEQEERIFNFSKSKREVLTDTVPRELRTSVMIRGIPSDYTRDDILSLLQELDFADINFFYLPMNFGTGGHGGYAFVNFRFPKDAREFKSSFAGTAFREERPEEIAHVHWRYPFQGFASHFDQYKGASITHARVPPQFLPTLIRDGEKVPFPQPWEKVKNCRKQQMFLKRTYGLKLKNGS